MDNNGLVAIKGSLRENGKLIIVLDDEDIKQMIKAKEKDEDFEEIIVEKLDSLLIELEK